jgi:hypothetical protein
VVEKKGFETTMPEKNRKTHANPCQQSNHRGISCLCVVLPVAKGGKTAVGLPTDGKTHSPASFFECVCVRERG